MLKARNSRSCRLVRLSQWWYLRSFRDNFLGRYYQILGKRSKLCVGLPCLSQETQSPCTKRVFFLPLLPLWYWRPWKVTASSSVRNSRRERLYLSWVAELCQVENRWTWSSCVQTTSYNQVGVSLSTVRSLWWHRNHLEDTAQWRACLVKRHSLSVYRFTQGSFPLSSYSLGSKLQCLLAMRLVLQSELQGWYHSSQGPCLWR